MSADFFDADQDGRDGASPDAHLSQAADTCATCQQLLVKREGGSVCVHCLASFLVEDDRAFQPGLGTQEARRYGHFEIVTDATGQAAELGRGAMGTAYRARDTVLDRAVALKVIDRGAAEHPAARTRFLREAQAAARFHHSNVASVLHYGEADGECFYVMELIEGETLAERVRREGPLSVELALEIAVQIARALLAAEAQGIVHRDLKPGNVMLAALDGGDGRSASAPPTVKVIDFGLARVISAPGSGGVEETRGGFAGTPAFASPEQFEQDGSGRIDIRSDIYSLGATLWYLLCGKLPFLGQSLAEIHAQQTRQPLPWDQLRAVRVPGAVRSLLRSLLAAAPTDRPQNARALLEALTRCHRQLRAAARRRFAAVAGAAGIMMLVAILAFWAAREHARLAATPPDRSLAILPFENLSADPADAFYAGGLQEQVAGEISRVAALRTVGSESTKAYPPGPRDLAAISRELGARNLVEGSVRRAGSELDVTIRLTDARDPTHPWTKQYQRRLPDALILQGQIAHAVAERLGAPVSPAESRWLDEPPTNDLAAYDLYLQANEVAQMGQNGPQLFALLTKTQSLLEGAVSKDPNFVLAYCGLANVHDAFYQFRAYRPPTMPEVDHYAAAEAALEEARALRPDAPTVHLATAQHLYRGGQDLDRAAAEVALAGAGLPNSPEVESNAGVIARDQGRWPEAVRHLTRWTELDPRNPEAFNELARTYHCLRRYDDYERERVRTASFLPPEVAAGDRPALAMISLERDANLVPLRDVLLSTPEAQRNGHWAQNMLVLQDAEGDAEGILRTLQGAKRPQYVADGCVYPRAWYEALAARMRRDEPGSEAAFTAARLVLGKMVQADPSDALSLSVLAMVDAGLGRTEDALREARRACEMLPPERAATKAPIARAHLAVVYAWLGRSDDALAELTAMMDQASGAALPIQPSYGDFKLNSIWRPLQGDPRFASLVERLAPSK